MSVERYLKPEVVRQIARLDLRAKFLVKGFLHGLHASPFHGFSVEFSEHRRYAPGDDPHDIDWTVFAKTEKYYVKKFEAETNMTGYIAVDKSLSMAYTFRQDFTKFQYAVSLAAALTYLMIGQQDPVGLITFDDRIRQSLPPRSKRSHLGHVLSLLARLQPSGQTDVANCLSQLVAMLKHQSLVVLMTDLLADACPIIGALRRVRHGGHDVILFHVLDEAEVVFPFDGPTEFEDPETNLRLEVDASGYRESYREQLAAFRERYRQECSQIGVDYVPLDTSMAFDKALVQYLRSRQSRF